jgi:hypothetical protein
MFEGLHESGLSLFFEDDTYIRLGYTRIVLCSNNNVRSAAFRGVTHFKLLTDGRNEKITLYLSPARRPKMGISGHRDEGFRCPF